MASYCRHQPMRYAIRSLRGSPWYSATAIAVIALGMTLATTAFAIVDGVLFKPLPYPRADELHAIRGTYSPELLQTFTDGTAGGSFGLSVRDVDDLAAAVPSASFAMHSGGASMSRPLGDLRPWAPAVASVDPRFLDVLGVTPLAGGFTAGDFETPLGEVRPALVTYAFWQQHLDGNTDVVGRTVEPSPGTPIRYRVVGILPASFVYPTSLAQPNLLTPLVIPTAARGDRARRSYGVIVRLPAGVDRDTYQARFKQVSQTVHRELEGKAWDLAAIRPFETDLVNRRSQSFPVVFGAALFVVLIACVNVSGLMASRSLDRRREIALRRALGARTRDITSLALAESALLIGTGTALALLLSGPVLALVRSLLPPDLGLLKTPALDGRVMAFAALAAASSAGIVSLWPLWQQVRLHAQLAEGGHASPRTRSTGRFFVVAVQVALGLVLTLGGALLVGSLVRVWQNDLGHRSDDVVVLEGTPEGATPAERANTLDAFLGKVRTLPGVESAGATAAPLWSSGGPGGAFRGDTYPITEGFVETVAPRLIEGRWPTPEEISTGAPVVVVTPFVVEREMEGKPAIGHSLVGGKVAFTVIGVAESALYGGLEWMKGWPQYYVPYRAVAARPAATIVIRSRTNAPDLLAWALREYRSPATPVRLTSAATADGRLGDTVRPRRLQAWLFGSFAVAALVVVGTGVLGLVAMNVARRTREVGIRVALGATRGGIVRLLMREQLLGVGCGLAAGGLASMWLVQFVRGYLYEMTVYDARAWAIAMATVAIVASIGVLVPARRASATSPVRALRSE